MPAVNMTGNFVYRVSQILAVFISEAACVVSHTGSKAESGETYAEIQHADLINLLFFLKESGPKMYDLHSNADLEMTCDIGLRVPKVLILHVEVYSSNLIINKKFWEELIAYFPCYDKGHIENDASNNSSIVACVFVTAVTFLPNRCLATIGGFLPGRCLATIRGFLPSRCLATIGGTHTQTAT
jgi:hypothetical protein